MKGLRPKVQRSYIDQHLLPRACSLHLRSNENPVTINMGRFRGAKNNFTGIENSPRAGLSITKDYLGDAKTRGCLYAPTLVAGE